MFKMGCSMARKILPSGSKSATGGGGDLAGDHPANKSSKSANETPTAAANKAKTGDELNDFSKLQDDPRLPLNVRQIFKITKSWKAIARTMSKTGTAMFLNLFEQNQDLFYLFSRFQHLKGKELHESMELREHAATVMSTLDQSISSLSDYDSFVAYLHSIGKLHRKVPGFRREHFWKIEQPFLKAVKQTLDERCNETIEEIYKIAIKLIIETIAEGYGEDKEGAAPGDIGDSLKGPESGGGNGNADGNGAGSPNDKPNDLIGQNNGGRGSGSSNNNCSNSQRPAGNKRTHSGQPTDHQEGSTTTTASLDNDKSVVVSCADVVDEPKREKRRNFYDEADRESEEEREADSETGSSSSFKNNLDQNNNNNSNQDNSMTKLSHELISLTGKLIEMSKKSNNNLNSRKTRTRRKRNDGQSNGEQHHHQQRRHNHEENLRIPQSLSEFSAKLDELLHSSTENEGCSTATTIREKNVFGESKNSSNRVADCRVKPINSNGNHDEEATKLVGKINLPNDNHDNKTLTSENKSSPAPSEWNMNVPSEKLVFNKNLHRAGGCPFGHKASKSNSSSVCPRAPAGGDSTTIKTMTDDGQTQSSKFLQQFRVPSMKPDATSPHKPLAHKSEYDRQLDRSRNDNNNDNRPTNYVTTAATCFPIGCRQTTRSGATSEQQLAHSTQVR